MVLDPDPNDPYNGQTPGPEGCLVCSVFIGLLVSVAIAYLIYIGIRHFELTLPSKIMAPHK